MTSTSITTVEEEASPEAPTRPLHIDYTPNPDHDTTTNTNSGAPRINRKWLSNLISHHAADARYAKHSQTLHPQYPILQTKALVVAPMVDQSDLPFRLLCRNHGANLCFTPMIHARMFYEKPGYRRKFWNERHGIPPEDRPLIVQLCGSHIPSLLFTMRYILRHRGSGVDGFDLNCGCPQTIAKRGEYGAFLLEKDNGDTLVHVVQTLTKEMGHRIPISVKVRILPSGLSDSLRLYQRLVDAGVAMLTVHGRNRLQKGLKTGKADWDAVQTVVQRFGHRIPVLSNGSIGNFDDVRDCLAHTGADGIMSSEGVLEYPPIFTETGTQAVKGKRVGPGRLQLARQYLELCQRWPPEDGGQGTGLKCVRAHLHRMLHQDLKGRMELREMIANAKQYDVLWKACDIIQRLQEEDEDHCVENEVLSWYVRHREMTDAGIPIASARILMDRTVPMAELDDEAAACFNNLFGDDEEY